MKKTLTASFLIASMLLAACNTTEETNSSTDITNEINSSEEETNPAEINIDTLEPNNSSSEQVDEEKENEQTNTTSDIEKEEVLTDNVNDIENSVELNSTPTINFLFNNEQFEAETTVVKSEQLNYEILLADGFTLTNEEPGRDILFYTADSNYSMRIEYYNQGDSSYESLQTTLENTMIASTNNNYETLMIEQSAHNIHKGTQFISVDEETGLQTIGAIFEKGKKIIVVTIFDGPENSLKDAFLQMAYSIE